MEAGAGDVLEARSSHAPVCALLVVAAAQLAQWLACRLYALWNLNVWKRCCCLFRALGTDQSSARDATATRWSARVAKIA